MSKKENTAQPGWIQSATPHLLAIGAFLILTLAYFYPTLSGKTVFQPDLASNKGMAKEIQDYREKTGDEALWTNSMFGGMPAYLISTHYKRNLFLYVHKLSKFGMDNSARFVFISLLAYYILFLALRISPLAAAIGAIACTFTSYLFIVIEAGHTSKAMAMAYMPIIVAGVLMAYKRNAWLGSALAGIGLSLQLIANHLQITYYLLFVLLFIVVAELIYALQKKQIAAFTKASALLLFAALLAVGTKAPGLLLTYEYTQETIRGPSELSENQDNKTSGLDRDYATQWSYGRAETLTLLVPNFFGGSSQESLDQNSDTYEALVSNGTPPVQARQIIQQLPMYWGSQPFTSGPVYLGAIACFLFVLGLFLIRGRLLWWVLGVTVLSILLAWGKNLMPLTDFFMDYIPLYNKFRAVAMTLVITEFAVTFFAVVVLWKITQGEFDEKKLKKSLLYSFYIVGGLLLFVLIFGDSLFQFQGPGDERLPQWLLPAIVSDRESLMRADAFRTLVLVAICAGILWAMLVKKIKTNYALLAIGLLIVVDLWSVNKRYLNEENFVPSVKMEKPFQPTAVDQEILKDTDPNYRVLNLAVNTFNDASTSYFHKSVGGYHAAKLRRYQDLIDRHISKRNIGVLNMLNTKYIIVKGQNGQNQVRRNPDALGNAWFVEEILSVQNADEEIAALDEIDPKKTAVVDQQFEDMLPSGELNSNEIATVRLEEYQPNFLKYKCNSSSEGVVVFSEIYYDKGWQAYLDGHPVPHFRANYVLRAMSVPKGQHSIAFRFEPKRYQTGENIALASSVALLLFSLGAWYWSQKNKAKEQDSEE